MPAKQHAGKTQTATLIAALPIHIAWGRGLPAWDAAPEPEPVSAVALVDEIGRRTAEVQYVLPDASGSIETPQGNYKLVAEPTRYLLVRAVFGFGEGADQRIREIGVFVGSQPVAGLPAGQRYFLQEDIATPGALHLLDRSQRFDRNGAVRPAFEYVLEL